MTEPGSSAATASPAAHTENRPNPALRSARKRGRLQLRTGGAKQQQHTRTQSHRTEVSGKKRKKKKALKLVLRVNLHCILPTLLWHLVRLQNRNVKLEDYHYRPKDVLH